MRAQPGAALARSRATTFPREPTRKLEFGLSEHAMAPPPQIAKRRDGHEMTIRNVVEFAREVRIHLRDAQVIFGSVTATASADNDGSFWIRPWGLTESQAIRFADISVATPVKQMGWKRHREIAAAQHAGVFVLSRKMPK
jgi:hypothetical protein